VSSLPALCARADALRADAFALLAEPRVRDALQKIGEPVLVGSVVSNLMVRREIDIAFVVGPAFERADAIEVAGELWSLPGACGITFQDEVVHPGDSGARDDRFHVDLHLRRPHGVWRLDLSLFLHDDHRNVARHHERLRDRLSIEQRLEILELKQEWAGRPDPPSSVNAYDEVVGTRWRADE
jgi:hypothetical protein